MASNLATEKTIQGILNGAYTDLSLLQNTSQKIEAENIVKFLFQALPFNHNYFSKRLYQTLFWKKDPELLAAILNELQRVSLNLLKILQQSTDEIQKELCGFVLGQILAIYPFLEPLPKMLNIPQKTNGQWHAIQYSTEKLELTPPWLAKPLTAYGLTSPVADSLLLFMGTPQPTASGAFLSLWTDLVPGFMVGELAFRLFAKKVIKNWLDKQKAVKIYGLSLGGSLAQLTACYLPDRVTEVHAYGAPGLFSRAIKAFDLKTAVGNAQAVQDFESECLARGGEHSQMRKAPPLARHSGPKDCVDGAFPNAVFRFNGKPQVSIYWQRGDVVPLLGSGFHPDFRLYTISCKEKQGLFFAHVRAIPALSSIKIEEVSPSSHKRKCARFLFNLSHIAFSIVMFPILTVILAFRSLINFIKHSS